MNPEREETVTYASHAVIRGSAPTPRIAELVAALERSGARVELASERRSLLFSYPSRSERWILLGGLAELLAGYEDVATWEPSFEELWQAGYPGPVGRGHGHPA